MITVNNQIQLHCDICSYVSHVINLLTTNLTYDNNKITGYTFHVFSVHILKLCQSLYYIIGPKNKSSDNNMYKPLVGDEYHTIWCLSLTVFKIDELLKIVAERL